MGIRSWIYAARRTCSAAESNARPTFANDGYGRSAPLADIGLSSRFYFVIECLVGVTVDVGAAFEMAKVNQTFQPSGRFSEANSL